MSRNIFAHDCEFDGADKGIRLKSNASRGGVVEKIWYQNIKMKNIRAEAIRINSQYGAYLADKGGKAYPVFRDISIRDVTCNGARVAVSMEGTRHKPLENISLENVSIKATAGMRFKWVKGLKLKNVKSAPSKGKPFSFENCTNVVKEAEGFHVPPRTSRTPSEKIDEGRSLGSDLEQCLNKVLAPALDELAKPAPEPPADPAPSTVVPEPSSTGLVLVGVAALLIFMSVVVARRAARGHEGKFGVIGNLGNNSQSRVHSRKRTWLSP